MLESYYFTEKSIRNKLATTTEAKLESFLSSAYIFSKNETYSTIDDDSNENEIEKDVFNISNNSNLKYVDPIQPLIEEEKIEEGLLFYYPSSIKDNNSNKIFNREKRKLFKVNYRIRFEEFNGIEKASLSSLFNEKTFLNNKLLPTIKRRRENMDNICKKIKTSFFNKFLYKKLNEMLKHVKSKLYFEKFPISFVNDIKKDTNKDLLDKSFFEILSNKEIYNENDLSNYFHNLKVIANKEILENEELMKILKKKYCKLYEEYINSKEFNIDEINRLKKNNLEDVYIKKYIYQSKHFIEYFAE